MAHFQPAKACKMTSSTDRHDYESALDLLETLTQALLGKSIRWMQANSDPDAFRQHPRFVAKIEAAERRLAASPASGRSRTLTRSDGSERPLRSRGGHRNRTAGAPHGS
jgi:hypothetical protein